METPKEYQMKHGYQVETKNVLKLSPRNSLSNFLKVYFDFAYFMFVSPFRLQYDENIGYVANRKRIPHLLIFALLNGLALLNNFSSIRQTISCKTNDDNVSPAKYFRQVHIFSSNYIQLLLLQQFIFHPQKFVNIVNFIQKEGADLYNGASWILKEKILGFLCFVHSGLSFCDCMRRQILDLSSGWEKISWNKKLITQAKYNFFLISNVTEEVHLPQQLTAMDYLLATCGALANIQTSFLDYYPDIALLLTVLTVRFAVDEFCQKLANDGKQKEVERKLKWLEVHRYYQNIRQLCEHVNEAFGPLVTFYLTTSLLFQATGTDHMLTTKKISSKIILLIYIAFPTCISLLSASVCSKLDVLRVWLTKKENRQGIRLDELQVILDELKGQHVGIRGSNTFTVTYSLLWNVLTTAVTYFIICLQTRQEQLQDTHCF